MGDLWGSVEETIRTAELEWSAIVATIEAAVPIDPTPCRCRRCNRLLTAPESIRARIGPACAALEAAEWQLPIERMPA